MGEITIDSLGLIYQDGAQIGYYDSIEKKCYNFGGTAFVCPDIPKDLENPTVTAPRTYWWVLLVAFIMLVILIGWLVNRK